MFPQIKTVKNRQFHTHDPGLLNVGGFAKKDFRTFSQNVVSKQFRPRPDLFSKINVFRGFKLNQTSGDVQSLLHESFFKMDELKSKFVSFSTKHIFFGLEDNSSSQRFLEVANNSDVYHFRLVLMAKSKDFVLDSSEVVLAPKATRSVGITFCPEQKTLFHHCKLDAVVTNERISDLNFQDLKKKNPRFEIQKRQISNCFVGDLK